MTKLRLLRKTTKKGAWGRYFRRKTRFLDDLGDPGEALGEALGRILERKFSVEKKVEKSDDVVVASAGDADPGKEGL